MSIQIDQIFTARAENIWLFLNAAGQGCYIPAYQRPYSWDKDNVDRLFEDAINGMNQLTSRPDSVRFLGTIIAIHDIKYQTVKPVFQSEVAQKVMTLIDGQQRIATSVMLNIALHSQLGLQMKRLQSEPAAVYEWFNEQSIKAMADLWVTFALDQSSGTPEVYRYYPRVIRAFDDVWSKKSTQAKYESPIAKLIWAYIQHTHGKSDDKFAHKVIGSDKSPDVRHEPITAVFNYIVQKLTDISTRKYEQLGFPDVRDAINNKPFMEALWSFSPPEEVISFISSSSLAKEHESARTLLRLLMFFKYFNTRMALTIVTTRSEDDAFDMFEALNTTGEPLTAFETFKPKVIEAEQLSMYSESPSFVQMERIERYLEAYKKADERQRVTSELLIPFALSESGDKLQRDLSDQRRYLRDHFGNRGNIAEQRSVVTSLANLCALMQTGWYAAKGTCKIEGISNIPEDAGFCFEALRELKHAVVLGALARFYDNFCRSEGTLRAQHEQDFLNAIKATTAFSMLWRGALGGTENIDGIYRGILRDGMSAANIPPLARCPKKGIGALSLDGYKLILQTHFFNRFPDRDQWVKEASKISIFDRSKTVATFLLLVASDDAIVDSKNPGLIKRGKKGWATTVRVDSWREENHYSIEHVAPQNPPPNAGWDLRLYEERGTIDRLGNLTLLPGVTNSFVGNRPWSHKKLIYRYLSSEDVTTADEFFNQCKKEGLTISSVGKEILASSS